MTPDDFRHAALSLDGAEEGAHMGVPDFRVGGRIFATLSHEASGYGNLMLSPAQQAEFVADAPELYLPVPGGWGRMGATHLRLTVTTEESLHGALHAAWKTRIEKTQRGRKQTAKP